MPASIPTSNEFIAKLKANAKASGALTEQHPITASTVAPVPLPTPPSGAGASGGKA